jgi:hypothetical protein
MLLKAAFAVANVSYQEVILKRNFAGRRSAMRRAHVDERA